MSFPFYRSSSSRARSRDNLAAERSSTNLSAQYATQAFDVTVVEERSSSRLRFPFLGKKRKSMVTLRSSTPAPAREEPGRPRHKTVSQLADETAARRGASSLAPQRNFELPSVNVSSLSLNLGSSYATPQKQRNDAHQSVFSSGSTTNLSTSNGPPTSQSKKSAEKSKSSFFFRVTSRPLSSRNSSADLKSWNTRKSILKPQDNRSPASNTPIGRPKITFPTSPIRENDAEDKDLFTSPRAAPTPPSLTFMTPESISRERLHSPSHSSQIFFRKSPDEMSRKEGTFQERILQQSPPSSFHRFPSSVSSPPASAICVFGQHGTHVENSVDQRSSSTVPHVGVLTPSTVGNGSTSPRRRSGVKIGREKVTLSVANVLEAGLGIEVGDETDEESTYGQSVDSAHRRFKHPSSPTPTASLRRISKRDSTDLPLLSGSTDDFLRSIKDEADLTGISQDIVDDSENIPVKAISHPCSPESTAAAALECQSPLSKLISASGQKDPSVFRSSPRSPDMNDTSTAPKTLLAEQSNGVFESLTSQSEVGFGETTFSTTGSLVESTKGRRSADDLQRELDFQCARFDRVAKHLLSIIQRHQAEKVQYEAQLMGLKKEVRRQEKEVQMLKQFIESKFSQSRRNSRRPVRVSSMQSMVSLTESLDDDLLAANTGTNTGATNREGRSSIEVSPLHTPVKGKQKVLSLKRSKTMPQLRGTSEALKPTPSPEMPLSPSPDVSGISLEFPMPEPLALQSIASTILSSARTSNASIPALTTAPTVDSGVSASSHVPLILPLRIERSPRLENTASVEMKLPGGYYQVAEDRSFTSQPEVSSSISYAKNLNATRAPTIDQMMRTTGSLDMDAVFKKLSDP